MLREAERISRVSSLVEATAKRGSWPYMAPEMLLEGEAGAAPLAASRSTDVYALGVLCWEVLSGIRPWEGYSKQRIESALVQAKARGEALPRGMLSAQLPVDLPATARDLLDRCLAVDRGARPKIGEVAKTLHQATQAMASGVFDVFLSHAWEGERHASLTTEVYLRLTDAGLRVWLDSAEMGANPQESMSAGIEASSCVVALLSDRYSGSANCMRELAWARAKGKPVVGCLAQAGYFPARGSALAAALDPGTNMYADLRAAAGVAWDAGAGVAASEREKLTKAADALPKVLRLVREHMQGRAAAAEAGAAPGARLEEPQQPVAAAQSSPFVSGLSALPGAPSACPPAFQYDSGGASSAPAAPAYSVQPGTAPCPSARDGRFVITSAEAYLASHSNYLPPAVDLLRNANFASSSYAVSSPEQQQQQRLAAVTQGMPGAAMAPRTVALAAGGSGSSGGTAFLQGAAATAPVLAASLTVDAAIVAALPPVTSQATRTMAVALPSKARDVRVAPASNEATLPLQAEGPSSTSTPLAPVFVMPLTASGEPDFGPCIRGSLQEWRTRNPNALVANVTWRADISDKDFLYLRGLKALNMSGCSQAGITDAAFAYLRGIHTLDMSSCRQTGITDGAFMHLHGIRTLDMSYCNQAGITDAAFMHLRGIHTLDMSRCYQESITDAAFAYLRGIHTLDMSGCRQEGITDAAFAYLRGIHTLNMSGCWQDGITDTAFVYLRGIHTLDMSGCRQSTITAAAMAHLRGISSVRISGVRMQVEFAARRLGLPFSSGSDSGLYYLYCGCLWFPWFCFR